MPQPLLRLAILAVAGSAGLAASELAPSADLGALPEISPRSWGFFNFAPDDQAVSAQVPRRRELAIGMSRIVDAERGLGLHAEVVWSPVRAIRADPPSRVDEVIAGFGASIERPMQDGVFGWRLSLTAGFRALADLHTAEYDRAEHRLLHGEAYHAEGSPESPDTADPVLAARFASIIRLTESDPLRHAPVDISLGARALRVIPHDGDGDKGMPDLRLQTSLLLPTRTTVSWFTLSWQQANQPAGSAALADVSDEESGWWFSSGGGLRLGAHGDWLVEVGSAMDLRTGVAVGTLGVVRTGDPPRAKADGTSSLEVVMVRGDHVSAGIATGDQLKVYGPVVLRSEIRTLIGDRSEPEGAVTADAVRLDAQLRAQLPLRPVPIVAIGPEAAVGLGLRRDAVQFANQSFASASRVEACGDIGLAGRVATGWKDGIASLEGSLGWAWWQALGGAEDLAAQGTTVPLAGSGSGIIMRLGFLALF